MTLNVKCIGSKEKPALFFLHGFLGMKEDWEKVVSYLQDDFFCILADLPGHGSPLTEDFPEMLQKTLQNLRLKKITLIGYSLGGRLSLAAAQKHPELFTKVLILSSHPGLAEKKERIKRLDDELKWERLLKTETLTHFLHRWYEQPLFSSLKKQPKLLGELIEKRAQHNPFALSVVLRLFSLGRQPAFRSFSPDHFFLYGEEDLKYRELYRTLIPSSQLIEVSQCGHAMHVENPKMCAKALRTLLNGKKPMISPTLSMRS
jgi:2-succinyl-6-hydroxy-2,4-cyclohexadiene-1-carboxylate synthase